MITKFKIFEQNLDIDPYGEEDWEQNDDMERCHDIVKNLDDVVDIGEISIYPIGNDEIFKMFNFFISFEDSIETLIFSQSNNKSVIISYRKRGGYESEKIKIRNITPEEINNAIQKILRTDFSNKRRNLLKVW